MGWTNTRAAATRARKLPYNHARYRERNRSERFFIKSNGSAALPPFQTSLRQRSAARSCTNFRLDAAGPERVYDPADPRRRWALKFADESDPCSK